MNSISEYVGIGAGVLTHARYYHSFIPQRLSFPMEENYKGENQKRKEQKIFID